MLTDFFDTMGTVTGVAAEAGLAEEDGSVPGVGRVLLVDSVAAAVGGLAGVSLEHDVHRERGRRRRGRQDRLHLGRHRRAVPRSRSSSRRWRGSSRAQATAPALVLVGYLMFTQVKRHQRRRSRGRPAGPPDDDPHAAHLRHHRRHRRRLHHAGSCIKVVRGKVSEVHPLMWVVSAAFLVFFLQELDPAVPAVAVGRSSRSRRGRRPTGAGRVDSRARRSIPLVSGYHRADVRTDGAGRRAAGHHRPAAAIPGPSPSPRTSWPARASRPRARPASPTSSST